jgi:hypothetical protein
MDGTGSYSIGRVGRMGKEIGGMRGNFARIEAEEARLVFGVPPFLFQIGSFLFQIGIVLF